MSAAKAASAPKERRKNSEKRKEKSRDAARCRRSKESEIFTELSQQLPLPENVACQLDKASVMRLAISYLRLREILDPIAEVARSAGCSPYDSSVLEALDAVLLVLSTDGEIVYLSDSVGRHLGLNQVDLMGQSVFDFCHPCDHDELKDALLSKPEHVHDVSPQPCHFLMRLRCTLGSKGRGVSVKSASSYKMMQCVGTRVLREVIPKPCPDEDLASPLPGTVVTKEEEEVTTSSPAPHLPIRVIIHERRHFLVCVAQPIPHPSNIEAPLGSHTFLSRHNPGMCFTHVDERTETFLGYTSDELLGKSVYSYFDPRDVLHLQQDFKTLFAKGQCETGQYRFLAKNGGCVWVLTQATLIYENNSCSKPQCVVCVNYVLSGASQGHEVLAEQQLTPTVQPEPEPEPELQPLPSAPVAEAAAEEEEEEEGEEEEEEPLCFTSSTSKIFAPLTADMNKDFLLFPDEDSDSTVLKDDDDDLTHLAPTAGDTIIPLEVEGLPSDVLCDSYPLPDIYGDGNKLLPDYVMLTTDENCPLGRKDPFLSYRDDSDPLSSPGSCGTPPSSDGEGRSSSCSDVPSLESPVDRFAGLDLKPERHIEVPVDDFEMRAPYIPMNGDDFPLLTADSVMWGPQDSPPGSSSSRSSLCSSPTFFATSPPPPRPTLGSLGPNPKSSLAALLISELPPPTTARSREWTKHRARTNHPRSLGVCGPPRQDLARSSRLTHPHQQQQTAIRSHLTRGLSAATDVRHHAYVTTALEQKMGMPSPPDPPPKRSSTERALGAGQLASPKRMRVDLRGLQLQNKDSVLLNLLVNGEDACHGYLCQTLRYDKRCPPSSPRPAPLLLDEPIPTLQDLSQLDAEVNAPIQQLLTGEDLLSALDQSVPALV
ncbi:hypoxia-inducible factor 1-alpha isoform X2 [Dermacentor silvarum]|uniref:hypoxia-inducible factor 1-alpha isoform X1 n=1 Tax=Dermacentor silvarum TaxID=543639 RepID=UPI00189AD8DE|nr:hypoxia-inducible factor 1-alpha isoform X1 [Dermacentor silvarum]XP_049526215.1 hypoxia-inducible factor 1-alpha isoform X2 [Dermacentor silvarum]